VLSATTVDTFFPNEKGPVQAKKLSHATVPLKEEEGGEERGGKEEGEMSKM
jgi:hypothetical protein